MTNQNQSSNCLEAGRPTSPHIHRKNTIPNFLARDVMRVLRWVIHYTLHSQNQMSGITMRNAGTKCFTELFLLF